MQKSLAGTGHGAAPAVALPAGPSGQEVQQYLTSSDADEEVIVKKLNRYTES